MASLPWRVFWSWSCVHWQDASWTLRLPCRVIHFIKITSYTVFFQFYSQLPLFISLCDILVFSVDSTMSLNLVSCRFWYSMIFTIYTVVSIVSCRCTYCCPKISNGKITRHHSWYHTAAFCYVHKCELSYIRHGHDNKLDIKLQPHRVKLYQIRCLGSGLLLAKALT